MIEKIPSGKWRVRVYHRGRCVVTSSFDMKKDATAWEVEQKRKLITGGWVDPRRGEQSLAAVVDTYLEVVDGVINPKTYDTDKDNLRKHIVPRLGERPIGAVTSGELDNVWAALIKGGLASSTVSRIRDSTAAAFNWAVRQKNIDMSPVTDSRVLGKQKEREVRPFTFGELNRTLELHGQMSPHYSEVTEFSSLTGLRWGEMVSLRVGHFQRGRLPMLRVRKSGSDGYEEKETKSDKERRLPLDEPALAILERRVHGRSADDRIFTAPRGGRMSGGNYKRAVDWSNTSSGHRFHDLRHTAATNWLAAGVEVTTVSKWLGHSTPSVTLNVYSHHIGDVSDNAALSLLRARREESDTSS